MRILLLLAFVIQANCELQTHKECKFPFLYKGEKYNGCVQVDGSSPWCSADLVYKGSFYYCNEAEAESYESSDAFLKAQEKLNDNAKILEELQKTNGDLSECVRCDASLHASIVAITDMRKIADDNERRLGWIGEKRGKDMDEFLDSIDKDLNGLIDCPGGTVNRYDYCYSFGQSDSFNKAKDSCKKQRSEMITIHSQAEIEWVKNQVVSRYGTKYNTWMGLNDIRAEGKFEWTDKSEVNYLKWNKGEPNNYPGENCVEMYTTRGRTEWNDISCTGRKNFVCKTHKLNFF